MAKKKRLVGSNHRVIKASRDVLSTDDCDARQAPPFFHILNMFDVGLTPIIRLASRSILSSLISFTLVIVIATIGS